MTTKDLQIEMLLASALAERDQMILKLSAEIEKLRPEIISLRRPAP